MTPTKADMRGELDALKRGTIKWYRNRFGGSDIIGMPSDREVLFDFIDHLAQRGLLQGVPEGWVLVPREPTTLMKIEGQQKINQTFRTAKHLMDEAMDIYCAMLSAAPKLPENKVNDINQEMLTALKAAQCAFYAPRDSVIFNAAESAVEKAIEKAETTGAQKTIAARTENKGE